jgi:hypothetical protein
VQTPKRFFFCQLQGKQVTVKNFDEETLNWLEQSAIYTIDKKNLRLKRKELLFSGTQGNNVYYV